eukprot:94570-Chlamydomonas_euryale.AAC.1
MPPWPHRHARHTLSRFVVVDKQRRLATLVRMLRSDLEAARAADPDGGWPDGGMPTNRTIVFANRCDRAGKCGGECRRLHAHCRRCRVRICTHKGQLWQPRSHPRRFHTCKPHTFKPAAAVILTPMHLTPAAPPNRVLTPPTHTHSPADAALCSHPTPHTHSLADGSVSTSRTPHTHSPADGA